MPDAALIQHQRLLAVFLALPWVAVEVDEEGGNRHSVRGRPHPGLDHEMEHDILGIHHFLPAEVFVVPNVLVGLRAAMGRSAKVSPSWVKARVSWVADLLVRQRPPCNLSHEVIKLNVL